VGHLVKKALITGITGQDGGFLTKLLLDKGYEVHGFVRRGSVAPVDPRVQLHVGNLTDPASLRLALEGSEPDEVYNLGAQSHVKASFDEPEYTMAVTALPVLYLLRALREMGLEKTRFYQASSSEMFGNAHPPQHEGTQFSPRSPYAVAKVAAHYTVKVYREAYGMFAVGGILFNHESECRGETFVTRKITRAVGRIRVGLQDKLVLGNLDAKRDWGYAGDYVDAMWRMLQAEKPEDYVIATGETHTIVEFLRLAFARADLGDWRGYVKTDPKFERPAEVPLLLGDPKKAQDKLGWVRKVSFQELVDLMVDHDVALAEREKSVGVVIS
jgi:GDPmannose 4,6-dehydratase